MKPRRGEGTSQGGGPSPSPIAEAKKVDTEAEADAISDDDSSDDEMQRKRRKGKKGKGRKKNVNPLFQLVPGKKKDSRKKAGRLPKVPLFDEEAAADGESLYSEPALPPVRRARAVSAPWRCAQRRGVRMKVRARSPQIPRDFSRTFPEIATDKPGSVSIVVEKWWGHYNNPATKVSAVHEVISLIIEVRMRAEHLAFVFHATIAPPWKDL